VPVRSLVGSIIVLFLTVNSGVFATKLSHWLVPVLVQNSYNLVRDPLGRAPLPHMELILFVARAKKRRPELAKRLRTRRALITEIVVITNRAAISGGASAVGDAQGSHGHRTMEAQAVS
jgi:hypothetical protein